ncbi:MAG: efflux RND transporter periplasmic adaptor subunit [Lachnospiraceae bacterium]|nr:efflux RND transporter periplasmic adaptor subunit [Lachnospiraceae bacterium]MDY4427848.1 efflux RND transporter periplasmic adaptor subunit [Lachnospiraceae bacterium]
MRRIKKSIVSIFVLSLVFCLTGCNSTENTEEATEDKRITVKVDTPKISSIENSGDFIGTVQSEEQVYVMSKLSGDVTETFFEVGDYVNEGDLLFTVDDTSAQIQLKQANASLSSANASLNTAKAGVNTANANINYQTASVTESFAKSDTTEKQLQLSIDQAEVNFRNNEINIGTLDNTLTNLKDKLNDVNDGIDALKPQLEGAKAEYAAALSDAQSNPTVQAKQEAANAKKSILDTYSSNLSSLESSKDSLESSIKQTEASISTAKNSNCLIVEQADIARDQKSDYQNYTRATIGNGGLASLAQAQAGVVQAEAGVVQSKAGITQAQAAVDAAKLQLDYANVTAPVSGIITSKGVTKNNMTSTGSVAYTIMSDGSKFVVFYVSEDIMRELQVGQSITVEKNNEELEAVITENPQVADANTGLFMVKARVNGNEDLVSGIKVKLNMTTKHADNVMTLPIDAVYHESEKSFVYTYVNGKANKVYVETGLYDDEKIEIISGITTDDQVITTWSSQLRNGSEVKVENSVSMNNSQSDDIKVERN